jgi:hypothetical protein
MDTTNESHMFSNVQALRARTDLGLSQGDVEGFFIVEYALVALVFLISNSAANGEITIAETATGETHVRIPLPAIEEIRFTRIHTRVRQIQFGRVRIHAIVDPVNRGPEIFTLKMDIAAYERFRYEYRRFVDRVHCASNQQRARGRRV